MYDPFDLETACHEIMMLSEGNTVDNIFIWSST